MGLLGELGRGLRDLNVTDAQRTQIRSIVDSHNAEMRQIGDRMRTAREALDDAVTAETADEAAIRARVADVSAVEADAAVLRARVHAEVFGVLTPEQQARARELKAQMKQRMQQRIGARMERRRERRRVFGR
jgi:protein CpxP